MTIRRNSVIAVAAVGALGLSAALTTPAAAAWKPKEITIVLPHSLGGGQDRLTRALVKVWSKKLGTKLVIKPKRGASGRIGMDYFTTQPQDGTTLVSTNFATTSTMYAQQQPNWKWEDTVAYLGVFGVDPGAVFVLKNSPFKSIKDVIAAAKKKKTVFALSSWASSENLTIHQLMKQTGAKFQVIPIGGGGDLVTAVLGGHVPVGLGKVSNIAKGGDRVRVLAVAQPTNPVKEMTNNAPPLDATLGTKTVPVASYRAILLPASLKKKHPDRYKLLKSTFEATKDDPEYIKLAKKAKISKALIVDKDHEELQAITVSIWNAFNKHGAFYKNKKKPIKVKVTLENVKKKGKYIYYTSADGKKVKLKVHKRRTKIWIAGKRHKGKKGMKKLAAGMKCEVGYLGVPVLAASVKCE